MKTKTLILILLSWSYLGFSQATSERKNDLTISPLELITIPAINVSYERLLNAENGVGVNIIAGDTVTDEDGGFQVSPFYRMYFGKKYASGFFLEAFLPINSGEIWIDEDYYDSVTDTYYIQSVFKNETSIGFGIGAGGKWAVKRNILFELSAGLGRKIITEDSTPIIARWMLGVGYRF